MANFTADPETSALDLFNSSTTRDHNLGARVTTSDGRVFRYARAGGSALVAGNVLQAPAQVTTHQVMTPAAAAIGATQVTVTLGATNAVTENFYAGGYLIIDTTPGNGYAYLISSHPAAAASATCVVTLSEPLKVALTTSSRCSFQVNPYNGVIQAPGTTLTGAVVGVAVTPAAASEYCWIQTEGVAPVLISGTPGVGLAVSVPSGTAGAALVDDGIISARVIGAIMVTGQSGKNQAVLLKI